MPTVPGRLDGSFYDLLASEARLASFVAIAKGDVPQHHWFHLGRLVTNVDGRATLMSWGGTMFEYLMPQLLMRSFPGTLLDQSCRASVRRQIEYGRQRGVPWGISESAYAFTDREGNYQYRAFGVPGLGLKRGLATDLVVAPYATALASLVSTGGRGAELRARSPQAGLDGRFGFYESLDYNPRNRDVEPDAPTAARQRPVIVRAYFAHHQGMSLVALANVVWQDVFVSRFHADPRIQATELLLQERVPREAILSEPRPAEAETAPPSLPVFASRQLPIAAHHAACTRISCRTAATRPRSRNAGGGYSMWRDMAVTRRREDPTSDAGAHYIYLRDPVVGARLVGNLPAGLPGARPVRRDVRAGQGHVPPPRRRLRDAARDHRVVRGRRGGPAADDHATAARQTREIEVTSYAEMVLARLEDDLAHPAFGKLFIETEFDPQSAGLLFSRRPRAADESPVVGFHVLGVDGRRLGGAVEWETDRARFIGRGRTPRQSGRRSKAGRCPARPARCSIRSAALRERLRLPPGAFVRVVFATGVAADRNAALALARKYSRRQRRCARVLDGVHARPHHAAAPRPQRRAGDAVRSAGVARVRLGQHRCISPADLARQRARSAEPVGLRHLRRSADRAGARVGHRRRCRWCGSCCNAQEYWRVKGLRADLVILNEHPADYLDEMQQLLTQLVQEPPWAGWLGKPGGMFLLRADGMADADRRLLAAVARVVLPGDLGDLVPQLERPAPWLYDEDDVPPSAALRRSGEQRRVGVRAAAGHGERARRLHARWARIRRRARGRARDAAAVVERAGQSDVRHDREQLGIGSSPGPATAARTG